MMWLWLVLIIKPKWAKNLESWETREGFKSLRQTEFINLASRPSVGGPAVYLGGCEEHHGALLQHCSSCCHPGFLLLILQVLQRKRTHTPDGFGWLYLSYGVLELSGWARDMKHQSYSTNLSCCVKGRPNETQIRFQVTHMKLNRWAVIYQKEMLPE